MGYEDREYFQSRPKFELSPSVHPATKGLLIAVVAAYLIALVVGNNSEFASVEFLAAAVEGGPLFIRRAVVLSPADVFMWVDGFKPGHWKLLTHWLVPSGLIGALIDALCLYFAGRMVEELFGTRRFLVLFIATCVLSGFLAALVDPFLTGGRISVIMGPAAGTFAAFVSLAWIAPNQKSILGLRIHTVVLILVGVMATLSLMRGLLGTAPVALSPTQLIWGVGLCAGYMTYLKSRDRLPGLAPGSYEEAWNRRGNLPEDDPSARSLAQAHKEEEQRQLESEKQRAAADADQARLDAILAKISAQGIGALSRTEKSFLDSQARKRKDSTV